MTYQRSVNSNGLKDTWQSWTMAWWDAPVVQSSTYDRDYYGSNNNYSSTQTYDGLGRLQRSLIADGKARAVHFGLNSDGQVVSRWQSNNSSNDPAEMHRFAAGRHPSTGSGQGCRSRRRCAATITNDSREDLRNYDYQALIATKTSNASGSGRFYQGATTGTQGGEFGTSGYDPVNAITVGSNTPPVTRRRPPDPPGRDHEGSDPTAPTPSDDLEDNRWRSAGKGNVPRSIRQQCIKCT